MNLIEKNNKVTEEKIAKYLNKTGNTIYRNAKTLRELGILERLGSKKKGYWKINIE